MEPTIISFEDLDLYKFNQVAHAWSLDFTQLSPGTLSASLTQVISKDVQLGYAAFNATVRQEGLSPEKMWTFAFVNNVRIHWRNYNVQPESIIIYAPASNINAISNPGFEVVTFSIAEAVLFAWAEKNGCLSFIRSFNDLEVIESSGSEWQMLRSKKSAIIDEAIEHMNPQLGSFDLDSYLSQLCNLIQKSERSTHFVSTINRLDLLSATERLMEKNFNESIHVADMATAMKVSERSLLYAFQERFDMGPKQFLKILKLNKVYHALRSGRKDSIADIARQCGFWHMGQFSKDYKQFFGELPSETMKRPI